VSGKGIGFIITVIASVIIVGVISSYYVLECLNHPPNVSAGLDKFVDEENSINLSGSASDPDGDSLNYRWEIVNDPTGGCSLSNGNSSTPIFHAPLEVSSIAQVTVKLTVTDGRGGQNTDTLTVTVYPVDDPLSIDSFSPLSPTVTINESTSQTFTVSDPDPDNDVTYIWKLNGNDIDRDRNTYTHNSSWDNDHDDETLIVTVEATNGATTDSQMWNLTVKDVNRSPTIYGGGPYSVDEDHGAVDMTVEIGAVYSDPEGDNLYYEWRVISGPDSLTDADTSTPTFHAPPEVSSTTYVTLEVKVSDSYGGIDTDTVAVTINPYQELAHKYMPTLRFESGGDATYFPVDCAFDGDLNASNNEAHYNELCNHPAEPLWVYIHEVEWRGMTYIEYWYYYVYNNYFNTHYNDWELMIVVLDTYENLVKVRYGSHGRIRDCSPSEVEWVDDTHPIAYVEEGSHAMDVDTGTFPGGWWFHTCEGVGYVAHWSYFIDQHTFFGDWHFDSGKIEASGYSYRGYTIQEANNGWWPADYGGVSTPWSERNIWNNPTLGSY